MSAIAGGLGIGAGVGLSSVALMPFNAANTFLGSTFFGYGMILGERYMYQADWPKIQARLEHGEKIENIIQEYTGVFTAVVMKEAKIIFDSVTQEMLQIMKDTIFKATPENTTLDVTVETPTEPQPEPEPFVDTGEKVSIKQTKTPVNFSDLHIDSQKLIVNHIQKSVIATQLITNASTTRGATTAFNNWLATTGKYWRLLYLDVPYKNPTPVQQAPYLASKILGFLGSW